MGCLCWLSIVSLDRKQFDSRLKRSPSLGPGSIVGWVILLYFLYFFCCTGKQTRTTYCVEFVALAGKTNKWKLNIRSQDKSLQSFFDSKVHQLYYLYRGYLIIYVRLLTSKLIILNFCTTKLFQLSFRLAYLLIWLYDFIE